MPRTPTPDPAGGCLERRACPPAHPERASGKLRSLLGKEPRGKGKTGERQSFLIKAQSCSR